MPVRVTVRVYMTLPEKLGWRVKQFFLEEDNPRLRDVFERLPDLYSAVKEYDEKGYPAVIMVNGRRIEFLDGYDTILHDGDEIDVFPPAAGG